MNRRMSILRRSLLGAIFILGTSPLTLLSQWMQQTSGTTRTLRGVVAVDPLSAIAVGDSGTILKTTNGGLEWLAELSRTVAHLNAVAYDTLDHILYIAGDFVVLISSDIGETWKVIPVGEVYRTISCSAAESSTVYAGTQYHASNPIMLFSTNAGASWKTHVFGNMNTFNIAGIGLVNCQAAPGYCDLYVETDYRTYHQNPATQAWDSMGVPISVTGGASTADLRHAIQYAAGAEEDEQIPVVARRTGNVQWTRLPSDLPPDLRLPADIEACSDSGNVYLSGSAGYVLQSTDRGETWSPESTGTRAGW